MTIPPLPSSVDTSNVPVEDLAGNKHLTQQQKIHEASRQFETIMLQQILSELQKPVITSEFTDDSTAADIYQGYATNALAESMSKSGAFGFAKLFEEQLSPHSSNTSHHPAAATPETSTSSTHPLSTTHP